MLLESAGLVVETEAPGVNEREIEAREQDEGLDPTGIARRLAEEKALAVSRSHPERLVLGADQVLEFERRILHKPADRAAARHHLQALAGRTHALRSAGALAQNGRVVEAFVETAILTVRPLDPMAIDRYLDVAGPAVLESVGAYQVEGLGIHLFEAIEGDHSTILGLPLRPLLAALRRLGRLAF
jgi:septum formation protein